MIDLRFKFGPSDQLTVAESPKTSRSLTFDITKHEQWTQEFQLTGRAFDRLDWAAGVFRGPIPSYDLVDLNAGYRISDTIGIGLAISNLFDEEHYQLFGGDLVERRALGHIQFSW